MSEAYPDDLRIEGFGNRRIRYFPGSDSSFRAAVIAAFELVGRREGPESVETALRHDYPGVRVVEQSGLGAAFGEPCIYVFRDGSAGPQPGD